MQEQTHNDAATGIVFDAAVSGQIGPDWFTPAYWGQHGVLSFLGGGRGGVAVITTPAGVCVLRHYHRGGLMARFNADRYLWQGAARTRSFAEFRLLERIVRLGLPGPAPVAARFERHGAFYTADLIMLCIVDARTLTQVLGQGELDAHLAARVGGVVAQFHRAGIWHADLNANNILLNHDGIHLIDFDRGRERAPRVGWRMANLRRLQRSLLKVGGSSASDGAFAAGIWQPLLDGYARVWNT